MRNEHDNQAWEMENQAYRMSKEGALFARKTARELRQKDIHEKIVELFTYGDAQNKIIDIGLKKVLT